MKIPNVNCKCIDSYGLCNKKQRVFLGLFRPECSVIRSGACNIMEKFLKPVLPPPPPPEVGRCLTT